jgi:hypothetical protein
MFGGKRRGFSQPPIRRGDLLCRATSAQVFQTFLPWLAQAPDTRSHIENKTEALWVGALGRGFPHVLRGYGQDRCSGLLPCFSQALYWKQGCSPARSTEYLRVVNLRRPEGP